MRQRWIWVLTEQYEDGERKGERLATTVDDGVAWFAKYFAYVGQSDFLTGRNGRFRGCDAGWLMKKGNFAKVMQGNYHGDELQAQEVGSYV